MFLKLGGLALLGIMAFGIVTNVLPRTAVAATFQVPDVVALFETTLASRITDTATSLTLTSALTKDATSLASSTYGLIIDEGQANEELILADCTATACTNLTRGLSVITATTSVSALKQEHRRGASVKITDAPALVYAMHVLHGRQNLEYPLVYASSVSVATSSNQLVTASFVSGFANVASTSAKASILTANNTWLGTNTYSSTVTLSATSSTAKQFTVGYGPSADLEVATKKYVDDTSFSGVSNANITTKGIVEQATVDEVNSASATGGTGASLFMTPATFAVSNFASSTDINWKLDGTLTFASSSVTQTHNLVTTGKRMYRVIGLGLNASSTSVGDVAVRINGKSGNDYGYLEFDEDAADMLDVLSGINRWILLQASQLSPFFIDMQIYNSGTGNITKPHFTSQISTDLTSPYATRGSYSGTDVNTGLTSISIVPDQSNGGVAITGTFNIYYLDTF